MGKFTEIRNEIIRKLVEVLCEVHGLVSTPSYHTSLRRVKQRIMSMVLLWDMDEVERSGLKIYTNRFGRKFTTNRWRRGRRY